MKISAVVLAATFLTGMGAVAPAGAAPIIATAYESYDSWADDGYVFVTNNSAVDFTDVTVNGADLGALMAGQSTPLSPGFNDPESSVNFNVAISAAGQVVAQAFTWQDYDYTGVNTVGTVSADLPEPVSMALLGAGLVGLGVVRRRKA